MTARTVVALVAVLTVGANFALGWGWPVALAAGVAVVIVGEVAGLLVNRTSPHSPAAAPPASGHAPLSRRELEVAQEAARGLTNKEIARRLAIGEKTVERHLDNINHKLGIHSRVQLTNWIYARGLLEPGLAEADQARASPPS